MSQTISRAVGTSISAGALAQRASAPPAMLVTALRREAADQMRKGRPWSLPLEDRDLLVAAYWRTNLTCGSWHRCSG